MSFLYKCASEKDFQNFLHSTINSAKVENTEIIPNNSWAWDSTLKAARINDKSADVKGAIQLYVGKYQVGDVVKLSAEILNVSGIKAKVTLDQVMGLTNEGLGPVSVTRQSRKTGEFEKIGFEHIITQDGYYAVVIGTYRADLGEFYLRNIEVEVESLINQPSPSFSKVDKDIKAVAIYTTSTGVFARQPEFSNDSISIDIDSVNKKLVINWVDKFSATPRPLVFAGLDNYLVSKNYYCRTQSPTADKFDVYIYDVATNTLQDPAVIPTSTYFSFMGIGAKGFY